MALWLVCRSVRHVRGGGFERNPPDRPTLAGKLTHPRKTVHDITRFSQPQHSGGVRKVNWMQHKKIKVRRDWNLNLEEQGPFSGKTISQKRLEIKSRKTEADRRMTSWGPRSPTLPRQTSQSQKETLLIFPVTPSVPATSPGKCRKRCFRGVVYIRVGQQNNHRPLSPSYLFQHLKMLHGVWHSGEVERELALYRAPSGLSADSQRSHLHWATCCSVINL